MAMEDGKVAELGDRNSGTIKRAKVKEPMFFHADSLVGTTFSELSVGDNVSFEFTESKKGAYATRVQKR
jgi:cold shock CspA family protein